MKKFITLAALALTIFSACNLVHHRIRGNGNIKTEDRNVTGFNNVDVSGSFKVYIKQDSAYSVKVEADENLARYILMENENGTLVIGTEGNANLSGTKPIKIYVSSPAFRDLDVSGACEIFATDTVRGEVINVRLSGASGAEMLLDAPKVRAKISGASSINLKGRTKEFSIEASGASKVRCAELLSENADVDISGAGSAHVFASVKLNVHASGASNVKYRGNPSVTSDVSGAGSVSKED